MYGSLLLHPRQDGWLPQIWLVPCSIWFVASCGWDGPRPSLREWPWEHLGDRPEPSWERVGGCQD